MWGEELIAGQQRLVPVLLPNYLTRLLCVPQTSFYILRAAQLTLGSVMAPSLFNHEQGYASKPPTLKMFDSRAEAKATWSWATY